MNKKRLGFVLAILLIIFLVFFAPTRPVSLLNIFVPTDVSADLGDFGGGGDYGGGDSDWGDLGGDWDLSWLWFLGGRFSPFIVFVVILILIIIRSKNHHSGTKTHAGKVQTPGAVPTTGLQPITVLKQRDPNFSEEDIKQRISNLYVQMQNCWTAKDITPLRGNFTDAQYAQYDRQLQQFRDKGHTSVIERIAVLDVRLMGVQQTQTHDVLIANLSTRFNFHIIDDKTGQVVQGNKNAEKFMKYEWTLIRPKDAKTLPPKEDAAFNCPNCAAPMNINQSAKCPYCDSIVSKADYDWVISGIKGLSQRTQ